MNFTEAFRRLGYVLRAPRTDWSAENDQGVCLSLWAREIHYSKQLCTFDTRDDAQPIETWNRKAGFKRRHGHIARAVSELSGLIDVVIVSGEPGGSYGDAHPWKPEERKAGWKITSFDPETGHFAAETYPVN